MTGQDVKTLRKKLLLLQAELADELGVSVATIRLWEQGKSNISIKNKRIIKDYCKEKGIEWKNKE